MKEKNKLTTILVTAGPTVEAIDPVRFISNRSTGEMGYAVARSALQKGYKVILISGPVSLLEPEGVEMIKVETTSEMKEQVDLRIKEADCLIMTAAVCDFRPAKTNTNKIKKQRTMTIELIKTPDILKEAGTRQGLIKVGFALETDPDIDPREKMGSKQLDLLVVNIKSDKNDPFGQGEKDFVLLEKNGRSVSLNRVTKQECGDAILNEVEKIADEEQ